MMMIGLKVLTEASSPQSAYRERDIPADSGSRECYCVLLFRPDFNQNANFLRYILYNQF